MNKPVIVFYVALRLFLGGAMVFAGVNKFKKETSTSMNVVEKVKELKFPEQKLTLQKVLYIKGMQQTGYAWWVLGFCKLLFGILLILQGTGFIGAIFLLPITLQILLFHIFLEPDHVGELIYTAILFIVNIALVLREKKKWKHLIWMKPL